MTGLKITAGQRTMFGLIADLTSQTLILPVIVIGHFWIGTFYFPYSCRLVLYHCQKLGTRWRLRLRTKATMAANSYKKMYGDKETFSNISIMSSRVFGARLETC